MSSSRDIWKNITKFIDANPDIRRIGLNKEAFDRLKNGHLKHGMSYHLHDRTFGYKGHVIYQIGE